MKKYLSVFLAMLMLLSMSSIAACSSTTTETEEETVTEAVEQETAEETTEAETEVETEAEETVDWENWQGNGEMVAIIFPTLAPEALQQINDQWAEVLSDHGYDPQSASAELDPTQYIPLIENYVTMGAVLLCISPMDPTSIEDIVGKARDAGVYITTLSAQPEYEIDGGLTTDNYQTGVETANLMLAWIEQNFDDCEENKVPVAVSESTSLAEYKARTEGVEETIESSGIAYVAYAQEAENNSAIAGFDFCEQALTDNGEIKCIILNDADLLPGANNYIMAMADVNPAEYCVVATGNMQDETAALIESSENNESVIRGLCAYGGETPGITLAEVALKLLAGEEGPVWAYDEIYTVNSFGY